MKSVDLAIVAEYAAFNTPADRIVADPKISAGFCQAVNDRLGGLGVVDEASLNQRLLNLRRRGQANGGLPRLKRDYHGRGHVNPGEQVTNE